MMFADRAKRRGMEKLSNLIYSVYDSPTAFMESVETYVAGEEFEYEYLYKALAKYANEHQYPLAQQAYEGAGAAEKIHAAILKEAANVKTYEGTTVYVCPICGYVMAGDSIPERCPVCGGPERQYEKF